MDYRAPAFPVQLNLFSTAYACKPPSFLWVFPSGRHRSLVSVPSRRRWLTSCLPIKF
jgi:hypothetical protein